MKYLFWLFACMALSAACTASAAVQLDFLFQDNMVVGHGRSFNVTGSARPSSDITVTLPGKTYSGKSGTDGRFSVNVDALPVIKKPFEMKVADSDGGVSVTNVVSGLLFLAAGQSNMEVPVKEALNPEEEAAAADYPLIREFKVEHEYSFEPCLSLKGRWTLVSPATAPQIGAVGYYTARMVQKEMDGIPVGIINNSFSATPIEAWLPESFLRDDPALVGDGDRHEAV